MTREDAITMSDSRLEQIQDRVAKATKGPWHTECPQVNWRIRNETGWYILETEPRRGANVRTRDDAEFIAHAREDVPYLLLRVRELETEIAACRNELSDLRVKLSHLPTYTRDPSKVGEFVLTADLLAVLASSSPQKREQEEQT